MPTLERISRHTESRASENGSGSARAPRRRAGFGPAQGNQALRRLIEKKRRKQEAEREAAPENPYEIALRIEEQLENDPGDASGHTRSELEALPPEQREEVVARLEERTTTARKERVAEVLSEPAPKAVEAPPAEAMETSRAREEEAGREEEREELSARTETPAGAPPSGEEEARDEEEAREVRRGGEQRRRGGPERPPLEAPKPETAKPVAQREGVPELPAPGKEETAAAPAEAPPVEAQVLGPAPAEARGEAAAPVAAPAPAAREAAAQPAPSSGGAPAAESAATLEAEPEEGPAAEESDKAAEKMGEAEPSEAAEEAAQEPEPPEPAEDTEREPTGEEKAEAEAADEEDRQLAAAGGPAEAEASEEEAAEAEDGAAAETAEVSGAEKEAGLSSLAEGGGGGGEAAGGGGGGGGGGAVEEQPEPEPPDVSTAEPAAAMGSLSGLKVGAIARGLGGVSAAIGKTVADQKQELAANPPTMERPAGSPVTRDGPISEQYPEEGGAGEAVGVEEAAEGKALEVPEPEPLPEPGPDPTEAIAAPPLAGGEGGELTEEEAENIQGAVGEMPTSDPSLETDAGPAPALDLEGDADPQQARDQRAELDTAIGEQETQGSEDAAEPAGEDEIYPTVPEETLEGSVPEGGAGTAEGAQSAGADDETAAIVAEEKEGDAVRSSVQQAGSDMAAKQQEHVEAEAGKRAETDREIAAAVAGNTSLQEERRQAGKRKVAAHRADWNEGQRQAVDKARTDADAEGQKLEEGVASKQEEADSQAREEIDSGTEKAEEERDAGEAKAESEKRKAESESSGVFGWLASKAKAFFNALKKAVSAAISAMRKAVKVAIEAAKKAAFAVIDAARNAVVGLIRLAGEALMAIGDVVLAAFPELKAKFRKLIGDGVAAAEDTVNRLADGLKKAVAAALDALGAALDALLAGLEKALHFLLDAANKIVQAAIKAAQAVIAALAAFAAIIKDVASGPGRWIANLGAAIMDGIRNHLWKAFKEAVQNWFQQKLSEVLGVGTAIFQVLSKGGIALAEVGKMAFEGLKAAIPVALIALLVEKLVSMIVPAAGAIMAIIEGLQAAWGAISRIIAAIGAFIAFLKAVKSGSAGPQFAAMLAAAAIVVIDFVANWLIRRIRGPASKIGGKVKAIARKIMAKLKKVGRKIKAAAKSAVRKVKAKARKVFKKKGGKSRKKDKRDQDKSKERLEKAVRELRPKLSAMLAKPVSSIALRAKLEFWRLRYRIKVLSLSKKGQEASIHAANSPMILVVKAVDGSQELVMQIVREAGEAIMTDTRVQAMAKDILKQRKAGMGTTESEALPVTPNIPVAATELGMAAPKPWQTTRMEMSPGGVLLPVQERQLFTPTAPSTWVIGAGKTTDVQATVTELGGPKAVATAFFAAQTGGRPTGLKGGAAGQVSFGEIMRLMAVEAARDPHGEITRLTMRMSEAERGGSTAERLVREQNPIGEKGGTGTAAKISRDLGHEAPGKRVPTPAEVRDFIRKELALTAQFIYSNAVVDEKIGGSVAQITNYIKKKLKDKLIALMREKYGL